MFYVTCYHIPDKRTIILYRILTVMNCMHTWNNKLRFWEKIVTNVVNKSSIMVAAILLITLNISMTSDCILKRNIFIKKFLKWWNLIIIDHPRILGNGCGIQEQNYVKLLQGSGMTAGYHTGIGVCVISCFRVLPLIVSQWYSGKYVRV